MDDIKDRFPNLPEKIAGLGRLAFNLWWSWHPAARMLFKRLDRKRWKETFYNPVKLLEILPPERLEQVAGDADFLKYYDQVLAQFLQETESEVCWFTAERQGGHVPAHRLFFPGVRPAPVAAVLCRGAGVSGRRPRQGKQRPGIALGGRGFHVSRWLPAPDYPGGWLAGRRRRNTGPGRGPYFPGNGLVRANS